MQVLLVEDAPVQRRFIRLVLTEFPEFEVDEVEDGRVAQDRLDAARYDLVLLDLNLPEVPGIEVLKRMRESGSQNERTPVVIVSVAITDEVKKIADPLGGVKYVSKPATAMRLRDAVRDALGLPPKPGPRGCEKRRTPRLFVPVEVRFETDGASWSLTTSDISPHGAFVVSDQVRPVGSRAKIALFLPHVSEPIEVGCQVAHVRATAIGDWPAGFGVRFDEDQRGALRRLVRAFTTPETLEGRQDASSADPPTPTGKGKGGDGAGPGS